LVSARGAALGWTNGTALLIWGDSKAFRSLFYLLVHFCLFPAEDPILRVGRGRELMTILRAIRAE